MTLKSVESAGPHAQDNSAPIHASSGASPGKKDEPHTVLKEEELTPDVREALDQLKAYGPQGPPNAAFMQDPKATTDKSR